MSQSLRPSPKGIVRVVVDSSPVLFTEASYNSWLEANGYAFLQQKTTAHGELVYATCFSDLIHDTVYQPVKMPLHSVRIGTDSLTNRVVNESLKELKSEVSRANGKVDQFISLIGGTFITIVTLLGLFCLFQMVKRKLH